MTVFIRAITQEQKDERRQIILESARFLFERMDFKSITIAQIAKRSGIAKGSVFLYFKTKEGLFLHLTLNELEKWNDEFDRRLEEIVGEKVVTCNDLLNLIDSTLVNNLLLVKLLAMINSIFEQNIDYEQAYQFKKILLERAQHTGQLLDQRVIFFRQGDGVKFYLYLYLLNIGLQQASNPSPIVKKVLQHPSFHVFNIDFRLNFLEILRYVLNGMEINFSVN